MLYILCGKIASGKSTLAARLGARPRTVVVAEDAWLEALFADELHALEDYVRCSTRLRSIMEPHVAALLDAGISVVMDFAANTPGQRRWLKKIVEGTATAHELHFLDVSDEVCLARLGARNSAGKHPFTVNDALFREVTEHFTPPALEEGFNLIVHRDADIQDRVGPQNAP